MTRERYRTGTGSRFERYRTGIGSRFEITESGSMTEINNNKEKQYDDDEIDGVNKINGGADRPPVDSTGDHLIANDRTTM